MKSNLFSNNDSNLPQINMKLPHIRQNMPRIKMTEDMDLLFDIDGKEITMTEVADKLQTCFTRIIYISKYKLREKKLSFRVFVFTIIKEKYKN